MKKISFIIITFLSFFLFNNCEEETIADNVFNYITFGAEGYSTIVPLEGSTTIDVLVLTSKASGSDRTFNVVVDQASTAAAGSYSIPSTVVVPSGSQEGILTLTLSDVDLGIGVNDLVIGFSGEDGLFNGAPTTVSYTQQCNEVAAVLDFTFDFYASETEWSIIDALDSVVASGGGYSNGQGTTSENITLCAGRDYTLTVTDEFSHGMHDGDNIGSYTLTIGGVEKVSGGGAFGASESSSFDTN